MDRVAEKTMLTWDRHLDSGREGFARSFIHRFPPSLTQQPFAGVASVARTREEEVAEKVEAEERLSGSPADIGGPWGITCVACACYRGGIGSPVEVGTCPQLAEGMREEL